MQTEPRIDRRIFTGILAAGSSVISLLAGTWSESFAAEEKPSDGSSGTQKTEEKSKGLPERVVPPSQEALLLTFITQQYPSDRFDQAALQGMFEDLRVDLARSRALSEFSLRNSDEPCFEFRAYRSPE